MAEDSDALVLSISADLTQVKRSLARLESDTKSTTTRIQKSFDTVGGNNVFPLIQKNASRSMSAIQNDARVMSFQLNDVFSGLAQGQGMRGVIQQLGQISQGLTGAGGIKGAAQVMGSALIGMPNLINLGILAFGLAASAAIDYFSETSEGSEKAKKDLAAQRDLIRDVASAWGDAFPALKAFNDELTRGEDIAKQRSALTGGIEQAWQPARKAVGDLNDEVQKTIDLFVKMHPELEAVREQWNTFRQHVADGTVTFDEAKAMSNLLNKSIASLPINMGRKIGADFTALLPALDAAIGRVSKMGEELANVEAKAKAAAQGLQGIDLAAALSGGQGVVPTSTQASLLGDIPATVADMIKKEEGFLTHAKWDTNAFRVGFGSDTFVDEMGRVQKVTKDTVVTLQQANADLARRIPEFQQGIRSAIGADQWANLTEQQQAALTSIAYNYGSLPKSIVKAIESGGGEKVVADAIAKLSANPERRQREAAAFGGASSTKASDKGFDELFAQNEKLLAQKERENAINADSSLSADQRASSLDREAAAAAQAQIAEQLLNAAKQQGLEITPELTAKINAQAEAMANAGLKAKDLATQQAVAQQELAEQTQRQAQAAQQMGSLFQSAIGGFISDLRAGKDAGEAFANMLNRIIDQLIQMALQAAFSAENMQSLFSGLGGLGGGISASTIASLPVGLFEQGGVVGDSNVPHRLVDPRVFRGARSMARGGMVGGGIPIIAHPGELIIPKNMVGRGGGSGVVDNSTVINSGAINIDMASAGLVTASTKDAKTLGEMIKRSTQAILVQESRPGGLLRKA